MAKPSLYRRSDYRRALEVRLGKGTGHEPPWRSPFWRDRARLVHCAAFRRLQGKTQLFAGLESDFFRNRLTHSLEVAQIARTIVAKLNYELRGSGVRLDEDLVEFAGLAHDLGHPPFGHTGEAALDGEMHDSGGFEGNAQTLRILSRLEKKLDDPDAQMGPFEPIWYQDGHDAAVGLNLCARSLAAILKYDHEIPIRRRSESRIQKGYYQSEQPVIRGIKEAVGAAPGESRFRVIECAIMDRADDIAYSTYDLEDAFKGGLLTPLDVLSPSNEAAQDVARRVNDETGESLEVADVLEVLKSLFGFLVGAESPPPGEAWRDWYIAELRSSFSFASQMAAIGFYRTAITSELVNIFVNAVGIDLDEKRPAFSRLLMEREARIRMSVLKQLTYVSLIESPRLRLVAHRGETVVRSIFEVLAADGGSKLLPLDFAQRYRQADEVQKRRVICDFIAGMTDRYAVELYARLRSDVFTTMFKPQ